MDESLVFYPDRRLGFLIHGAAIILLTVIGLWGLWQAANADIGLIFFVYLLPALMAVVLVPVLLYRVYALYVAYYALQRDGIRIRWGLRVEQIPMDIVEWVHPADDLEPRVPLPFFRLPGAVIGTRKMPGGGKVEFLASSQRNMLIIATPDIAYAISPADASAFRAAYNRIVELGSVTPLTRQSLHPTFVAVRVWASRSMRSLIIAGFILNIVLLAYVLWMVSSRQQIHLGFRPSGEPSDLVPAVRLMLLPVLSLFFFLIDLFVGLFFYRSDTTQDLAYLAWTIGVVSPMLFFVGAYLILQSG